MDTKGLKRLVELARKDPKFFHDLVFDPEHALAKQGYLDKKAKAAILRHKPEEVLAMLLGEVARPNQPCNNTCAYTCEETIAFRHYSDEER